MANSPKLMIYTLNKMTQSEKIEILIDKLEIELELEKFKADSLEEIQGTSHDINIMKKFFVLQSLSAAAFLSKKIKKLKNQRETLGIND